MKQVLAIESSCDDTSVAVVNEDRFVVTMSSANQDLVHRPFGGVVPEIAGRNHANDLMPLIEKVISILPGGWRDIDGIAVTNRPGLVGSLLVGIVTAKTLALAKNKTFIGVHHIEGHLVAPFLCDKEYKGPDFFSEPFLALIVSGGHTHLYLVNEFNNYKLLGRTIDDAAGEAFDKFAKMLGLGYPGGAAVDREAQKGKADSYDLPRPLSKSKDLRMSFSGLKTAAHRLLSSLSDEERESRKSDLSASYQQAVVDVLLGKLKLALKETKVSKMVISGGVSANSALREQAKALCSKYQCELAVPPLRFCTDNAAMIGLAGLFQMQRGNFSDHSMGPNPRADLHHG